MTASKFATHTADQGVQGWKVGKHSVRPVGKLISPEVVEHLSEVVDVTCRGVEMRTDRADLLDRRITLGRAGHQAPGSTQNVKRAVGWNERHGHLLGISVVTGVSTVFSAVTGSPRTVPDTSVVRADRSLQGLGDVPPQVPGVGDLHACGAPVRAPSA
ncbi:hypothetical protein [Streptomyces sp. NBC_01443]|uniref:hypothetical protein n=1 Tax=Streptomyces sp. NBC_01443 TaxID=2903868 RepID=UPI0022509C28|nr:hypothetical protein [Streptomyces sp. NBC_01443]MCX4633069.1 hypothetical protein [Streptomyces sp. NBC_01443]